MENKTRINWIALSIGFAIAVLIVTLLLPSTRWIPLTAYRQISGEEDIWNLGPNRILGDSADAELARILISGDTEDKIASLTEFVGQNPSRADALAHLLRYRFMTVARDRSGRATQTVNAAATDVQFASQGADLEPENGYWPLVEAAHWSMADDVKMTAQALHRAVECAEYNDYGLDEATLVLGQLRSGGRRLTSTEELAVYSRVMFPHYAHFIDIARRLSSEETAARTDLATVSVTVSRHADTLIMHFVSQSMARLAILPEPITNVRPNEEELRYALEELKIGHPKDAEALDDAFQLALGVRPDPSFDVDQAVWDTAFSGHYVKQWAGAVLWLLAAIVLVVASQRLTRLGKYERAAKFAPFCGFLLFGWIALTSQEFYDRYSLIWEQYIPEIAIAGFLLGFVAMLDKFTKFARWTAFALTLAVLPAITTVPVLLLPIVVIWASLLLSSREPSKRTAIVLSAISPCLLTLPLAIMYSTDLKVGVLATLVVLVVTVAPLGWSTKALANKRPWAAVSIVIPCLFVLYSLRMNMVADSSVGVVLENELKQVVRLRDTLTPRQAMPR